MRLAVFILAISLGLPTASAEIPEWGALLARLKRQMGEVLNHMPDYTCLVTLERSSRPRATAAFSREDILHYEIAHTDGKELFAWTGARHFEDQSIVGAVRYGVISNGEFVLHARTVFLDGYSNIRLTGPEDLDGRSTLRWDYQIPMFGSGMKIFFYDRPAHVGSHGSFWVDPTTLDLIRLDVYADGIPLDFPYTDAVTSIEYSRVRIGSRNALLPQSAMVLLQETSGKGNRNVMEFSHCRQYAGESAISFDVPETTVALPPSAVSYVPAAPEPVLAAGLTIRLRLSTAIDSTTIAIGDPLEASVVDDVTQRGKIVVPAGSIVRGRFRRMEKRSGPPVQYGIGLEFTGIEMSGKHVRFFGEMKRLETAVPGFVAAGRPGLFQSERGTATELHYFPAVPGVATFLMKGASFVLPQGMTMVWITTAFKSPI
jgi:hypothetical protein